MPPAIGTAINILASRESWTVQAGYYYAFGEAITDEQDDHDLVRFYWDIESAGAPVLLRQITQVLNRFEIPFRFKCQALPAAYVRTDAAVLFVSRRYCHLVGELLAGVWQRVTQHMRPETPLFTKRLALGLGLAEEPRTGESFGMHRCRLVAEGMWAAFKEGDNSEHGRLRRVMANFAQSGVDVEHPYLNARSTDVYDWAWLRE